MLRILKTASMDNIKNLELELLIIVRQNTKVLIDQFHKLFDHKWILYHPKFNELLTDGYVDAVKIAGMVVYELTSKGKGRINELLKQRESDVTIRLLQLKQQNPEAPRNRKSVADLLQSIFHPGWSQKKLQTRR